MKPQQRIRGFLPEHDPAQAFPSGSELGQLDELGRDLPSLLEDALFRQYARALKIPAWPDGGRPEDSLPLLRLYYVRLGFLASAYVNQVGQPNANLLPANIAVPLCRACSLLGRPPILSYDGYALYNWKRFDPAGPVVLGNIDTLQNFVHLYDEHWFILVHVEIEAIAGKILAAIDGIADSLNRAADHRDRETTRRSGGAGDAATINKALAEIAEAVWRQVEVLRRIPEKMDPALYFKTFRPYIRFFENVVYEGVDEAPMNFRGETGAQSSIMPTLIALMKIDHRPSALTDHLADMRRFMPVEHREVIQQTETLPSIRHLAERDVFNEVLEAMATFREVHYGWAEEYINRRVADPRGTGGTPYMTWLKQMIDETRAHAI